MESEQTFQIGNDDTAAFSLPSAQPKPTDEPVKKPSNRQTKWESTHKIWTDINNLYYSYCFIITHVLQIKKLK